MSAVPAFVAKVNNIVVVTISLPVESLFSPGVVTRQNVEELVVDIGEKVGREIFLSPSSARLSKADVRYSITGYRAFCLKIYITPVKYISWISFKLSERKEVGA